MSFPGPFRHELVLLGEELHYIGQDFPNRPRSVMACALWEGPTLRLLATLERVGPGQYQLEVSLSRDGGRRRVRRSEALEVGRAIFTAGTIAVQRKANGVVSFRLQEPVLPSSALLEPPLTC